MVAEAFSEFKNEKKIVIFASGVSDSQEVRESEFSREKNLLLNSIKAHINCTFVYFSTCSMHDPIAISTPYVKHKIHMENIIIKNCRNYHIFRVSQIIGYTRNQKTLINFIVNKINSGTLFDAWEMSTRNLIDIEDVKKIVTHILNKRIYLNQILHVANQNSISILQLIQIIEEVLEKKAHYLIANKGAPYSNIDIDVVQDLSKQLNIKFDLDYIARVIRKYYSGKHSIREIQT